MASARFETESIIDKATFHAVSTEAFGFYNGCGRNMDAWIDCFASLRDEHGMTKFKLGPDEMLEIEVTDTEGFSSRTPDLLKDLVECTAAVNQLFTKDGEHPVISLVFI